MRLLLQRKVRGLCLPNNFLAFDCHSPILCWDLDVNLLMYDRSFFEGARLIEVHVRENVLRRERRDVIVLVGVILIQEVIIISRIITIIPSVFKAIRLIK